MDYTVEYDETTGDYTATAGDEVYSSASGHLAYLWLAAQMMDEGES